MNLEPIRTAIEELDPATRHEWEPYFNHHGDPFVVEKDRKMFGTVASIVIDTHPPDYGRTLANYVATVDPATVTEMCDEIERLRRWKHEAMVLDEAWDRVWDALGKPGLLGEMKQTASRREVERLQRRIADMKRMVNGCPRDTDRDGNCGQRLCPFCGEDYQ